MTEVYENVYKIYKQLLLSSVNISTINSVFAEIVTESSTGIKESTSSEESSNIDLEDDVTTKDITLLSEVTNNEVIIFALGKYGGLHEALDFKINTYSNGFGWDNDPPGYPQFCAFVNYNRRTSTS